ncbi:pyridoxamine 5-phosphate oxidase [Rhodobacteraceae bacterium SC52]|nr:pyridoxamine 5-phosphate oxidase [Rhodobacteraceae bacterium SC52]
MADTSPINPTTNDARELARKLLREARYGAVGVSDPATGAPQVSRIAVATAPDGQPLTLISDLSAHTVALKQSPVCSLLVGEPGTRGDPLTHPRITLACRAEFIAHGGPGWANLREHFLQQHPKSRLYIDFTDFSFARLVVDTAALNGGFGKAFHLTADDLGLTAHTQT